MSRARRAHGSACHQATLKQTRVCMSANHLAPALVQGCAEEPITSGAL